MGLVLLVSLVIVALLNLSLGLVIILGSERRNLRQILFFVFSTCVAAWAFGLAMFLATGSPEMAVIWARLYYFAAALIGYSLIAFALTFVPGVRIGLWLWLLLLPFVMIIATIVMPGMLIESVAINLADGNEVVLGANAYYAYTLYFLTYMYGSLAVVAWQLFKPTTKDDLRYQLRYIFIGLVLAGTFGVFFNLLLPLVGNYKLIWIGPQFSILLVGFIFAAIVRHKLFDVRVVIARASAYLALLITMAMLYGLAVFGISSLLFQNQQISLQQNALYVVLAVFLAFTFQPLKSFFDRITERIFFRHEYKPEEVLSELGTTIADEINLRKIAMRALELLAGALKPSFAVMMVLPKDVKKGKTQRFDQGRVPTNTIKLLEDGLTDTLKTSTDQIIITQEVATESVLKDQLEYGNIALALRLETSRELVGYILLGDKQSGVPYNAKDMRMLSTIGDELGLAVQNALRFEEIEHFNITLKQQVEDATAQLRDSNKKLKELDTVKDEFISMASHQLRTPLTSVKGYLSMVLDGDAGKVPPEQHKLLDEAFMSAQRMVYLVGDFLNVSRIQTGKFMLEARPTNLCEVVADEIERLEVTAQHRSIHLDYEKQANCPTIMLDEDKIRQVIMNFIDNAIYYSRQDGHIRIDLQCQPKLVRFTVTDTGIGVPKAEADKLFTKFFRATNARRVRPDGTGIGLFLAKKVVTAHGGSVIVESKENEGSTFGFTLPLETGATVAKIAQQ